MHPQTAVREIGERESEKERERGREEKYIEIDLTNSFNLMTA